MASKQSIKTFLAVHDNGTSLLHVQPKAALGHDFKLADNDNVCFVQYANKAPRATIDSLKLEQDCDWQDLIDLCVCAHEATISDLGITLMEGDIIGIAVSHTLSNGARTGRLYLFSDTPAVPSKLLNVLKKPLDIVCRCGCQSFHAPAIAIVVEAKRWKEAMQAYSIKKPFARGIEHIVHRPAGLSAFSDLQDAVPSCAHKVVKSTKAIHSILTYRPRVNDSDAVLEEPPYLITSPVASGDETSDSPSDNLPELLSKLKLAEAQNKELREEIQNLKEDNQALIERDCMCAETFEEFYNDERCRNIKLKAVLGTEIMGKYNAMEAKVGEVLQENATLHSDIDRLTAEIRQSVTHASCQDNQCVEAERTKAELELTRAKLETCREVLDTATKASEEIVAPAPSRFDCYYSSNSQVTNFEGESAPDMDSSEMMDDDTPFGSNLSSFNEDYLNGTLTYNYDEMEAYHVASQDETATVTRQDTYSMSPLDALSSTWEAIHEGRVFGDSSASDIMEDEGGTEYDPYDDSFMDLDG